MRTSDSEFEPSAIQHVADCRRSTVFNRHGLWAPLPSSTESPAYNNLASLRPKEERPNQKRLFMDGRTRPRRPTGRAGYVKFCVRPGFVPSFHIITVLVRPMEFLTRLDTLLVTSCWRHRRLADRERTRRQGKGSTREKCNCPPAFWN